MAAAVIQQILYDIHARRLVVVFLSGRRYAYSNVPPDTYVSLQSAPSRGAYFNQWIRDRYSCQCVDADLLMSDRIH